MDTCIICKQSIEPRAFGSGRKRKYCSDECINKANNLRRRKNKEKRQIWDGDKKICFSCNAPKEITEYQISGKKADGTIKYASRCKECSKETQTTAYRHNKRTSHHFTCKQCGTPSTHYDKRYTTFCTRECSFAYTELHTTKKLCKKCGSLIRRGLTYCVSCRKEIDEEKAFRAKLAEQEKFESRIAYEKKREQQRLEKIQKQKEREKLLNKMCIVCNTSFKARTLHAKTCDECATKRKYLRGYIHDVKRGKRSAHSLPLNVNDFDADITLDKLVERDKSICHICSAEIDLNDFKRNKNGAFIALNNYPSIDHVIPLIEGGTHSWNNVKLAHFYCNSIKNDKLINDEKEQLEFFL